MTFVSVFYCASNFCSANMSSEIAEKIANAKISPIIQNNKKCHGCSSAATIQKASQKPMMLILFATWCSPCMKEKPCLDYLAKLMKDEVLIMQVCIEKPESTDGMENCYYNKDMSNLVQRIPLVLFFDKDRNFITCSEGSKKWTCEKIKHNCRIIK